MSCYYGGLQPPDWYWFRYFTFEMLAQSRLTYPGKDDAKKAAETCRRVFIERFADEIEAQEKKLGNKMSKEEAAGKAQERWRDVLKNVVGLNKSDFDGWARSRLTKVAPATAEGFDDAGGEEEE